MKNYASQDVKPLKSAAFHAWRHPIRTGTVVFGITAVVILISRVVATAGTGFTETTEVPNVVQHKTLWDWLNLLLVPLVLGVSAFLFNLLLQRKQTQLAREENETDREISRERSSEETLRHYLDTMQQLVLERGDSGLRHDAGLQLRNIARARTLAVIRALSGSTTRINQVIQFLRDSELLDVVDEDGKPIDSPAVTLSGGDFTLVDLRNVNLSFLNLQNTIFEQSDLEGADLAHARLTSANFKEANLARALLSSANLVTARLEGVNLARADVCDANLEGADLTKANLTGTYFLATNLEGACFHRANLDGAYLAEAKMSTAIYVTQEQLDLAKTDKTELPDVIQ